MTHILSKHMCSMHIAFFRESIMFDISLFDIKRNAFTGVGQLGYMVNVCLVRFTFLVGH